MNNENTNENTNKDTDVLSNRINALIKLQEACDEFGAAWSGADTVELCKHPAIQTMLQGLIGVMQMEPNFTIILISVIEQEIQRAMAQMI